MPKPRHVRYTFSGTIVDGATILEQWSFGVSKPAIDPITTEMLENDANLIRGFWQTRIAAIQGQFVHLTETRVALVGADGKVEKDGEGAYIQGVRTWNDAGALAGGTIYPLQTALCVTLLTPRSGPTGKGRFYLPALPQVLGSDHRWSEVHTDAAMQACAAFLGDINGLDGPDVAVVSTKGYSTPVNVIRVGRRPDVMRSRARSQGEAYRFADVPTGG